MRAFQPGQEFYNIIKTAIPDFVESEYPLFVEFISAFLQFLEQERTTTTSTIVPSFGPANLAVTTTETLGGPLYEARKLLDYRDTQTTLDEFRVQFLSMFAKNFPQYSYLPTDWFVRSLRTFYQEKGTENSIKWFFRAFFNEEASVYYPRTDIFKASDGTWVAPITLKVSAPIDGHAGADITTYYTGQRVITSTGQAIVDRVSAYVVGASFGQRIPVYELTLRFGSLGGAFTYDQELVNIDSDEQVRTRILPVISAITVGAGGTQYAVGDYVAISEGPGAGGGYNAYGVVRSTTNGSISGVNVVNGGNGFSVGEPVEFFSGSGNGAAGYVETLTNTKTAIFLDLTIEPFANSTATVTLDSPDYGAATGVTTLNGADLDTALTVVYAAADTKPFYTPWVWTNSTNSAAVLANVAILADNISVTPFVNTNTATSSGTTGKLFVLNSALDVTTNTSTATITANAIGYFVGGLAGNTAHTYNATKLYLSNVANLGLLTTSVYVKQDYANTQTGTVTTHGNSTIVGANTVFQNVLRVNAHMRVGNASAGYDVVVKSIESNTALTIYGNANTVSANVYATYPMGRVRTITPRAQTSYGTVNSVILTSAGSQYAVPPLVIVDSMDARVQELYYYVTANDTVVSTSGRAAGMFANADLEVIQGSGQIARIDIQNSGVLYTDANSISITAQRASGQTGITAELTAVLGAVTQYSGQFTTTRSFSSSDKYLQDGNYYNDYTYVVKAAQSFDRYRDVLLKLMHPAGFRPYGQYLLVSDIVLDLSPETGYTDFIPVDSSLNRRATDVNTLTIPTTGIEYVIQLGESSVARTRRYPIPGVKPEDSIFFSAAEYDTRMDYDDALYEHGFTPQMQWSLTTLANLSSTGAQTVALTASAGVTLVSDDGPTYPVHSVLLANTTQYLRYTFANANAVLFNSRSAPHTFRGGLSIWYYASDGIPAANAMIFGDRDWLWLSIDSAGKIHGQVANDANTNIMSDDAISPTMWNHIVLAFDDNHLHTDSLKLFVNGRMQQVVGSAQGTYVPGTISIGSSNTAQYPSADGRYGQATVLIEPPTQAYVNDLYASGQRDGTETLTIVRQGQGIDLLYYWNNTTINTLASNTISQEYYANAAIDESAPLEEPDSGLSN